MQVVKVVGKEGSELQSLVRKLYGEGFGEEFKREFNKVVKVAIKAARDAVEFASMLQPLLRKAMVWINVRDVDAVRVDLGEWNKVVVKICLKTREIVVSETGVDVVPLDFYVWNR